MGALEVGQEAKYMVGMPYMVGSPHTWGPGQPAGQLWWKAKFRGGTQWEVDRSGYPQLGPPLKLVGGLARPPCVRSGRHVLVWLPQYVFGFFDMYFDKSIRYQDLRYRYQVFRFRYHPSWTVLANNLVLDSRGRYTPRLMQTKR